MIRTGPAGWSYADSPGHVYPADAGRRFDALAYLASYFDTIEINSTFYAPQPPRNFASWVKRVAHNPEFRFAVKLWQRFTHDGGSGERGAGPREARDVQQVTEGLEVLREAGRLGAVLAQFPWSFKPSDESRDVIRKLSDDLAGWPVVVELRHGGWAKHEYAVLLKDLGLGFANIDQPVIGESIGPTAGATSAIGYVRFHGRRYDTWFERNEDSAQRYDYLYTAEELEPWVDRIKRVASAEGVQDVYVISNNHFEGKGPA
ncbi:MAG: DUF72 domain-containing protein, partial [Gemmatimonadales bacterium]|nr:DUF72 domain-containing protein [Gemmatimonadales bacterium]